MTTDSPPPEIWEESLIQTLRERAAVGEPSSERRSLVAVNLGLLAYGRVLALQKALAHERMRRLIPNTLLLVRHPPTITLGKNARKENLLATDEALQEEGIGVYHVDRGGDITYHGPGQMIGYPILNLREFGKGAAEYVRCIEDTLVCTLSCFGILAERRLGYPGVWVGSSKIASIGVRIQRWVSWHGFALNIRDEASSFCKIIACGLRGVGITCIETECLHPVDFATAAARMTDAFVRVFGVDDLRVLSWEKVASISLLSNRRATRPA